MEGGFIIDTINVDIIDTELLDRVEEAVKKKLELSLEGTKQDAGVMLGILKAYRELLEVSELLYIREALCDKEGETE